MVSDERKLEELRALVQGIRERVRRQYPETAARAGSGIAVPLADLMPVVHARDAALGKVAAIGAVNPRPGGLANRVIQNVKHGVARSLQWFVRDQVAFNQSAISCVEALMEAVNELNRSLVSLGAEIGERMDVGRQESETALKALDDRAAGITASIHAEARALHANVGGLPAKFEAYTRDIEVHVAELARLAEEQARAAAAHERDVLHAQHREFTHSLEAGLTGIQQQLWGDMDRIRLEFERTIHSELRVVRQRSAVLPTPTAAAVLTDARADQALDYPAFAARFRGTPEHVKAAQGFYAPRFAGSREVVDLGSGNGEFLEVMQEAGIPARGVESNPSLVAACRARSLEVIQADLFSWLAERDDKSLPALFCAQVVEHLPPARVPELVNLCAAKLERNGLLVFETPNPECLAIFATHFYLDPTHTRPVPAPLMAFYLEEAGMGGIDVVQRFPAAESWPELNELPAPIRNRFFGGLDYAIFARRL